jgi:hypothetical protein
MIEISPETGVGQLVRALELMRAALNLLDEANAPHDLGAHLDLAICRLELLVDPTRKAA